MGKDRLATIKDELIDPGDVSCEDVDWLIAENERLQAETKTLRRIPKGEVWYYGDDGEDYPDSLVCPVIMEPDVLRRLLAADAIVETLPKTADGVTIVPRMVVWPRGDHFIDGERGARVKLCVRDIAIGELLVDMENVNISKLYSTREAAELAPKI